MGRIDPYTLRRRRLMGLCLLSAFLLAGFALNGWTVTPVWSMFHQDEGTFVVGDPFGDWIYAECDGKHQQITVSRNGRLEGMAGLESLRALRSPNRCRLPNVDNPDLADWQARLARLQTLTRTPGSAGAEVLSAARDMPISYLYLKPLSDWVRATQANAVAFLDAVAERPMQFHHPDPAIVRARRQAFSGVIETALAAATVSDVPAEKLEAWLAVEQIAGSSRAIETLARVSDLGRGATAMLLERLETVNGRDRGELYATLAPAVAEDPEFAASLAEELRLLPRGTRSVRARQLLLRSDASSELAIALLSDFRRTFRHERADAQLDLFMAVANKLRDEAEAPLLLTRHLKDLPDIQRRMAATYLLSLDDPDESAFALAVLRTFADLHPLSRPKVLHAVMDAPQFRNRSVQEASLLAVRLETHGRERQALLSDMLQRGGLDEDLYARIRAELG